MTFRLSEFIGPRIKVRLRDEGWAPRGRDSSYLSYFHPKGCLVVFSILRGCLARFMACDKAALFTLHTAQILGLVLVGKQRVFGLVFFIEFVVASVNLMLGF